MKISDLATPTENVRFALTAALYLIYCARRMTDEDETYLMGLLEGMDFYEN